MSIKTRRLTYSLAINEALTQMMERDPSVILIGQGVKSPWYVGNTAQGLIKKFGEQRVIDTPVSENAMTGAAIGASLAGMRAIAVHPRMDFMLYAFDPIVNEAANWSYMNGGKVSVPVVFWGVINRGGEQAAQHSQALHAMFSHAPGLKVVMPSTAYDAKGLMVAAIEDDNPVVYVDDRWLYNTEDDVPEELYSVPIGKGIVRREGKDVSVIASSYLVGEAVKAASTLEPSGIDVEVVDLRTVKPLDVDLILASVEKTGRAVIVDPGWKMCGLAAEISAVISENSIGCLKSPIRRVTLPDIPAPASRSLEENYYISSRNIVDTIMQLVGADLKI
ncbi:MAG: alpha-ketoacid dehydrogenase subunit beta [Deltaproteobacteria bacterium]|nr:MAG: alpha-ketoacid dehydrogenase subunit beta [Deltaproteobacteria bacterium]